MNKIYFTLILVVFAGVSGNTQKRDKLFSLLSNERTNVNFVNTITDEKERNIFIYSNYYGGAGVGIGDFNNDGLQDLFFAGNIVGD